MMLTVDAIAPGSGDEDVTSSGEDGGGDWDQEPGSGAAQELEAVEWSQWSSCSPSCSQTRASRCLDTPGTMMDCIQVPGLLCHLRRLKLLRPIEITMLQNISEWRREKREAELQHGTVQGRAQDHPHTPGRHRQAGHRQILYLQYNYNILVKTVKLIREYQ